MLPSACGYTTIYLYHSNIYREIHYLNYPDLLPYWPRSSVSRTPVDLFRRSWVQTPLGPNFLWSVGTPKFPLNKLNSIFRPRWQFFTIRPPSRQITYISATSKPIQTQPYRNENRIITGAQPKAGTGQNAVHFCRFFQRYIVRDISLTWDIAGSLLLGVLAGSMKFYPPFWKARGMEVSQQKDYSFLGNDSFLSLYDAQVYLRKFKSEYLERQFYERLLKS